MRKKLPLISSLFLSLDPLLLSCSRVRVWWTYITAFATVLPIRWRLYRYYLTLFPIASTASEEAMEDPGREADRERERREEQGSQRKGAREIETFH